MRECCTDHKGQPKRKYKTQSEAEKVAELRREEGVVVKVYPCEEGNGWHLTSHNLPPHDTLNIAEQRDISRHKQKGKNLNPLGNAIDDDLKTQLRQNALDSLERKINIAQETLELKQDKFEANRKIFIEMRQKLKLEQQDMRLLEQELRNLQNEYTQAKRRKR